MRVGVNLCAVIVVSRCFFDITFFHSGLMRAGEGGGGGGGGRR